MCWANFLSKLIQKSKWLFHTGRNNNKFIRLTRRKVTISLQLSSFIRVPTIWMCVLRYTRKWKLFCEAHLDTAARNTTWNRVGQKIEKQKCLRLKECVKNNKITVVYSCVAAFLIWFRYSYVGFVHIRTSYFTCLSSVWMVYFCLLSWCLMQ